LALSDLISITVASVVAPSGINFMFLAISVILSLCGFFALVYSNYLYEEWEKEHKSELTLISPPIVENADDVENSNTDVSSANTPCYESRKSGHEGSFWMWILTGLFCSTLMCSWSTYPTIGRTLFLKITNPALINLLVQSGQTFAVPFVIYLFGYLDVLGVSDVEVLYIKAK
jgi:hypothetical protein